MRIQRAYTPFWRVGLAAAVCSNPGSGSQPWASARVRLASAMRVEVLWSTSPYGLSSDSHESLTLLSLWIDG